MRTFFITLRYLILISSIFADAVSGIASAQDRTVLTTIAPIHSLTHRLMQGAGEPDLLLQQTQSPHSFQLRPSDVRRLANAGLIIWIGKEMEAGIAPIVNGRADSAYTLTLANTESMTLLAARVHDTFDRTEKSHGDDQGEDSQFIDMHFWLDPKIAVLLAEEITKSLIKFDPENAEIFSANLVALSEDLRSLHQEIVGQLAPVLGNKFLVFHDAFQYYEARFGLKNIGSITLDPHFPISIGRAQIISKNIKSENVGCIFSEAQSSDRFVKRLSKTLNLKTEKLDPIGVNLDSGPELYFNLLRTNTSAIVSCLSDR